MFELFVVLTFLFSLSIFGRRYDPDLRVNDCDWLAMPIGLCLVGLVGNVLYFMFGFSRTIDPIFVVMCALYPVLLCFYGRGVRPGEWCRLAAVLGIFLLLAFPAWIGGEQYYVFRGNIWDQFFYLNQALILGQIRSMFISML